MVHLILSSTKGNQGLRFFPYTGYLGLTPIRVEGVVRTKLDADLRQLQATSLTISIRCYESRLGRVNILQSNVLVDHTLVLWSKADNVEFEPIGSLEYPFRLTLPSKVNGFSTAVFVDYRCMWRIEAVLNHVHIAGVGSRQVRHFELPLVRYDLPTSIPLPLPDPGLSQTTAKPRAPRIRYNINTPVNAVGPNDLVSIPIHLLPMDSGVTIRSASVVVERRIELRDSSNTVPTNSTTSTAVPHSPSPKYSEHPLTYPSSIHSHPQTAPHIDSFSREGTASTSSLSSSNPTITPNSIFPSTASITSETQPLLPPPVQSPAIPSSPSSTASKTIVNSIVEAESSGRFSRDAEGVWHKMMTLQWPAAKSHSRWAVGETIKSDLVTVRFFVRVKIVVQSPGGNDTLELSEKEIFIVSTNNAERQLAITKYNEMIDTLQSERSSRSKSKSPRRTRVDQEELPPSPYPPASSVTKAGAARMPDSLPHTSNPKSRSAARRPHTSAGPRDKPATSGSRLETSSFNGRTRDIYAEVTGVYKKPRTSGQETNNNRAKYNTLPEGKRSGKGLFFSYAPKIGSAPSGSSTSTTASSSSISSSSQGESDADEHMREWEEELAKIEMKSRRSSDLLGFTKFLRKRPSTAVSGTRVVLSNACDAS